MLLWGVPAKADPLEKKSAVEKSLEGPAIADPPVRDGVWSSSPATPAAVEPVESGDPPAGESRPQSVPDRGESRVARPRTFMERVEGYVTKLSTRSNFWHRVCAWIWLPFAYRSGIKMLKEGQKFSAVLPFRRFNKNWYKAMAGAALLGNSEIAGGMYVFNECGGEFGVVCKQLEYRFKRPCVGPAIYRITPREDIQELAARGREFNVILDMEIVQVMRTPQEKERRVGRCTATFHATPIVERRGRERARRNRRHNRKER
jgi:hypothetical protein